MSDSTQPPRLQVKTPGDIAELVPYLIGFPPQESLVILVVQDGIVQVTARVDLADVEPAGGVENLLDRVWSRFPGADAVLVAYTERPQAGWELLHRSAAHLAAGATSQTIVVQGDSWQLPDGQRGTINPTGPVAAAAASRGLRRIAQRADLEAELASAPISQELIAQLAAVIDTMPDPDDLPAILARTSNLLHRNLPPDQPTGPDVEPTAGMSVEDAMALALLAQHHDARNLALLSITRDNARQHFELWRRVINRIPEPAAEQPLFIVGMAAWIDGEGARASIALSRLQAVADATQTAGRPRSADLLDGLIDRVIPPSTWDQIRLSVLADSDTLVRRAIANSHGSTRDPELRTTRRVSYDPQPMRPRPDNPGLTL